MDREELGARALRLAYRVQGLAANAVGAAGEFRSEHGRNPEQVTGDYVSDLVAELRDTVRKLSAVVRELDKVRAELDAASFAGIAAAVEQRGRK
jgi:hypothetical protein